MLSLSLALVCNVFPTEEQPRALGIWAAVSAIALAIGPLAGGLLIELDWRVIFWMNLPVLAIGVAITVAAAPESTDPGAGSRIDLPGLAALSVGLTAVVLALIQAQAWSDGTVVLLGAAGLLALAAFWAIEHRVREPIVEFAPLAARLQRLVLRTLPPAAVTRLAKVKHAMAVARLRKQG